MSFEISSIFRKSFLPQVMFGRLLLSAVCVGLACPAWAEHRDLAPLSDGVVQQLLARSEQGLKPIQSIDALNRHLDELTALVDSLPGDARRMHIAAKRHELARVKRELLADLAQNAQHGVSTGLAPGQVDPFVAQVQTKFEQLDRVLADTDVDSPQEQQRAVERLRAHLDVVHGQVVAAAMLPSGGTPTFHYRSIPLTTQQPTPSKLRPQFESSYQTRPLRYAFLGNTLLASGGPATPAEAASCGYVAADTAATPDAPKDDPQIAALAKSLGYSPVQIFQYVYNNIEFQPYYGSLKGALVTLQSKAGGPTDQASLLIALLRASGIPARYVRGRAQVSDPSPDPLGGRIARWVGAKSYTGATYALAQGRFLPDYPTSTGVTFNHVWVEACVPYSRYRGIALDNSGERWIPLDPSFKDKSYQPGMTLNQTLDVSTTGTYMSGRKNGPDSLPNEAYALQVEAAARNPRRPPKLPHLWPPQTPPPELIGVRGSTLA